MSDFSIRDLQTLELDMLSIVDSICNSLNIQYFLVGGTLLGAVRHKGFIPWDDDIDIGMLRKDYEIFIQEAQELLPSHLFLQTFKTDKYYPNVFAKIRNNRTTFIESSAKNIRMNHGAYIDIFPFDYYPDNFIQEKILSIRLNLISHAISSSVFTLRQKQTFLQKVYDCVARLLYPNHLKAVELYDFLLKSQKKSSLIKNYGGAWGRKEIVPAKIFESFCKLPFENHEFWVPSMYHEYLTHIYGDYMKLPPEEKRVAHHYAEVIDLDKPYAFYLKDGE